MAEKIVVGWCSWCYYKAPQELQQSHTLVRSTFSCSLCHKRTLPCRGACGNFVRGFGSWDEEYCAQCQGRVLDWADGCRTTRLFKRGRCSWCFEDSRQLLYFKQMMFRSTYECGYCGRLTKNCKKCFKSYARSYADGTIDEQMCALCSGLVGEWSPKKPPVLVSRWCRRCLTHTQQELESTRLNVLDVYTCISCKNFSSPCIACEKDSVGGPPCEKCSQKPAPRGSISDPSAKGLIPQVAENGGGGKYGSGPPGGPKGGRLLDLSSAASGQAAGKQKQKPQKGNTVGKQKSSVDEGPLTDTPKDSASVSDATPRSVGTPAKGPTVKKSKSQRRAESLAYQQSLAAGAPPIFPKKGDEGRRTSKTCEISTGETPPTNPENLIQSHAILDPQIPDVAAGEVRREARVSVVGLDEGDESDTGIPQRNPNDIVVNGRKTNVLAAAVLQGDAAKLVRPPDNSCKKEADRSKMIAVAWRRTNQKMARFREEMKNPMNSTLWDPPGEKQQTQTQTGGGGWWWSKTWGKNTTSQKSQISQQHTYAKESSCVAQSEGFTIMLVTDLLPQEEELFEEILSNSPSGRRTLDWCLILQKANLKGITMTYLLVTNPDGSPAALGVTWTASNFDLTRYLGAGFAEIVGKISFFGFKPLAPDLCFVQIPFMEQPGLIFPRDASPEEQGRITGAVAMFLRKNLRVRAISILTAETPPAVTTALKKAQFDSCPYLPDTVLDLRQFATFLDYVSHFKSNVKHVIRQRLRAFQKNAGEIRLYDWREMDPMTQERIWELCVLTTELHSAEGDPDLIEITPSLCAALGSAPDGLCQWLVASVDGVICGCMLVFFSGKTSFGLLQGLDYDKSRPSMVYFNLLYAMIQISMEKGMEFVRCGCTTYWTKKRLGCELPGMDLHFAGLGSLRHLQGQVSSFLSEAIAHAGNWDG